MPELPEVHTTATILNRVLPGLKIQGVWSDWKKTIKQPKSFEKFKKELIGRKILGVERCGKNILINLFGNLTLLVHMKMTGHLRYKKPEEEVRFVHLLFNLSNGKQLALADMRKFAKVLIFDTDKMDELRDLKNIGPNPLSKDFSFKKFKDILSGRRGVIKDVLMKQEVISGIGNIYSSEILWEAGIYPFKDVGKIKEKELEKIYKAVKKILKQGVKLKGDSIVDYRDPYGGKGGYQHFHKAYGREGEGCLKKDGGIIKRVKKGGRSTFYCSKHQKL